jgi:parvulin-like peptidyl-prolyl isomerase
MADLIRINDETITADSFIKLLRLSGRFDALLDEVVKEKLVIHAAKKARLTIPAEAVQQRADELRRVRGLHRAADMKRFLESMKITLDDYEAFVVELLYYEHMMKRVLNDEAVEQYFRLNSPKFDSIDVSHILVDSAGKAKEIMAILEDEPEMFADLAREHSVADTRAEGGYIGRVLRGSLQGDVEAKVFHANEGDVLGPFASPDGDYFEIFTVNAKRSASFDDDTKTEIRRLVKEEWLAAQAREHRIDVL